MMLQNLYDPLADDISDQFLLDRIEALIKTYKNSNTKWRDCELYFQIMLRLIEHLLSQHKEDLAAVVMDLFNEFKKDIKFDQRTYLYILKVQNRITEPDYTQIFEEHLKFE